MSTAAAIGRRPDFVLGLDLGQTKDYTALAVLERTWAQDPRDNRRLLAHYALRHLQRWPLQTSYPKIVANVAELVARPPMEYPLLVVDQTGVGRPVVDLLRLAQLKARLLPIVITTGHEITDADDGSTHVPKKELVSAVQVLLQGKRIKFAPVPERELLVKELVNFKVKITLAANETFEAWREKDHDDLVLAVALAAWWGEARGPAFECPTPVEGDERPSLAERMASAESAQGRRNIFGRGERGGPPRGFRYGR